MPLGREERRVSVDAISEERIEDKISRTVWRWRSYFLLARILKLNSVFFVLGGRRGL